MATSAERMRVLRERHARLNSALWTRWTGDFTR